MPKEPKHLNILSIAISAVSAVVAVVSVYFTYSQLSVATNQQATTTKLEDLRFVGHISVEMDEVNHRIRVSNYSDLPLVDATLWTLGLAIKPDNSQRLDTIREPLAGLGSCRTITVSINDYIKFAEEGRNITAPRTNATEPYLTFKAPSGSWYTISETRVYDPDNGNYLDSMGAARNGGPEDNLPDSVLEGEVSEERTLDSSESIGPSESVAQVVTGGVQMTNNGCSGPDR